MSSTKGTGTPHVAAETGEYDPPQNGAPEEKSWSDRGPITLLWGLLNDFLSFPVLSSHEIECCRFLGWPQ